VVKRFGRFFFTRSEVSRTPEALLVEVEVSRLIRIAGRPSGRRVLLAEQESKLLHSRQQ
jgi:hypothetical protein